MLRKEATQLVENMWKSRKEKRRACIYVLNVHNIIVIIVYMNVHINDATENLEEREKDTFKRGD